MVQSVIQNLLENEVARWLALVGIFLAVVIVVVIVGSLFGRRTLARQRLDAATESGTTYHAGPTTLRGDVTRSRWIAIVNKIEAAGVSLVDTRDESLRRKLIAAGYTGKAAPRVFTFIRLALTLGLPVIVVFYMWVAGSTNLTKVWMAGLISMAMGLYLPNLFVRARADRRQEEIVNGFPDALDLMLVCVEAGLGLETAFDRVGQEMAQSHPLLAEQFGATVLELRAGRSREDALRRMADRSAADEVRSFATLLIQSTKLGSSVAQTLRTYAAEMREKRRMRAEERAHRLPVLLSIPLVGCMLPTMIGVLMVPAVIRVLRAIVPQLD